MLIAERTHRKYCITVSRDKSSSVVIVTLASSADETGYFLSMRCFEAFVDPRGDDDDDFRPQTWSM